MCQTDLDILSIETIVPGDSRLWKVKTNLHNPPFVKLKTQTLHLKTIIFHLLLPKSYVNTTT